MESGISSLRILLMVELKISVYAHANLNLILAMISGGECVRRRVMKSVAANPYCSEAAAKDAMEGVWDVCYNDTQLFDRAP